MTLTALWTCKDVRASIGRDRAGRVWVDEAATKRTAGFGFYAGFRHWFLDPATATKHQATNPSEEEEDDGGDWADMWAPWRTNRNNDSSSP